MTHVADIFLKLSFIGDKSHAIVTALIAVLVIAAAIIDARSYIIPDRLLLVAFIVIVAAYCVVEGLAARDGEQLFLHALQSSAALLGLWLFWYFNADGFGYGDLKLLVLISAFVPLPAWILMLLLACVFGVITYLGARLSLRFIDPADSHPPLPIPFGPCICAAWMVLALPELYRAALPA